MTMRRQCYVRSDSLDQLTGSCGDEVVAGTWYCQKHLTTELERMAEDEEAHVHRFYRTCQRVYPTEVKKPKCGKPVAPGAHNKLRHERVGGLVYDVSVPSISYCYECLPWAIESRQMMVAMTAKHIEAYRQRGDVRGERLANALNDVSRDLIVIYEEALEAQKWRETAARAGP